MNARGKTDTLDANALARLGEREGENLRPYKPVPEHIVKARDLLTQRKALVEHRVAISQTMKETGDPGGLLKDVVSAMVKAEKGLEKEIVKCLERHEEYKFLLTIPGVGPLSSAVLVCTLERGEFLTSDSLVAFAGLDPRPMESGKHRGTRRLSHQGDAQLRTILFMAARTAARLTQWKDYHQKQLDKGLSKTEATVILARKMVRTAFGVYRQKAPFAPRNTNQELDNKT